MMDNAKHRILIGACGYESRSSHFFRAEDLNEYTEVWIVDYSAIDVLSYNSNRDLLSDRVSVDGDTWISPSDLSDLVSRFRVAPVNSLSVTLDCSSMDRGTLATILTAIKELHCVFFEVAILYFPQTFSPPSLTLETVSRFGPVSRQFSGSSRSSSEKMCLIMGVGYEFGKAIGAQDFLEPDELYAYFPIGTDPEFEECITKANSGFDFVGAPERVISYPILQPEALLDSLFDLIDYKRRSHRVMILPMGPKLFAALSLVVALRFHPEVRVWRYSTHSSEKSSLRDAYASGQRVCINVHSAMGQSVVR